VHGLATAQASWPRHAGLWHPKPLSLIALVVALLIVMPLAYVVGNALLVSGDVWVQLWQGRVPELLFNTLRLAAGVAAVTLVSGVGLAWLVVRYDFPGRGVWTWLLAAPLGIPPYIMAYVYTEMFAYWGPLRPLVQGVLGADVQLPALYDSFPGAVLILSLATYPYVYLLSRAAFLRTNVATRRPHGCPVRGAGALGCVWCCRCSGQRLRRDYFSSACTSWRTSAPCRFCATRRSRGRCTCR
jgi:ABC-type spermidine/putrescine transport system permease subunit II